MFWFDEESVRKLRLGNLCSPGLWNRYWDCTCVYCGYKYMHLEIAQLQGVFHNTTSKSGVHLQHLLTAVCIWRRKSYKIGMLARFGFSQVLDFHVSRQFCLRKSEYGTSFKCRHTQYFLFVDRLERAGLSKKPAKMIFFSLLQALGQWGRSKKRAARSGFSEKRDQWRVLHFTRRPPAFWILFTDREPELEQVTYFIIVFKLY